jgi:hypothetical protein
MDVLDKCIFAVRIFARDTLPGGMGKLKESKAPRNAVGKDSLYFVKRKRRGDESPRSPLGLASDPPACKSTNDKCRNGILGSPADSLYSSPLQPLVVLSPTSRPPLAHLSPTSQPLSQISARGFSTRPLPSPPGRFFFQHLQYFTAASRLCPTPSLLQPSPSWSCTREAPTGDAFLLPLSALRSPIPDPSTRLPELRGRLFFFSFFLWGGGGGGGGGSQRGVRGESASPWIKEPPSIRPRPAPTLPLGRDGGMLGPIRTFHARIHAACSGDSRMESRLRCDALNPPSSPRHQHRHPDRLMNSVHVIIAQLTPSIFTSLTCDRGFFNFQIHGDGLCPIARIKDNEKMLDIRFHLFIPAPLHFIISPRIQ